MCSSLPSEILDLIADHLHDEPDTLKACSLISKSWVPRARRHLFAHVEFGSTIQPWIGAFPDPSSSPAHHTRTLRIRDLGSVTAAGPGVGHWIRAFHSVVHLHLDSSCDRYGNPVSLFHGLSPAVKSLHLYLIPIPYLEIFDFVCSFPLLEDFIFSPSGYEGDADIWIAPLTSPRLTGLLELEGTIAGIRFIVRRMLDFPNSLHFTKIVLAGLSGMDFESITSLVSRCSDTLESLNVAEELIGA